MKRLINPMEMVRALARGDVRHLEVALYGTIFFLGNVLSIFIAYITDTEYLLMFTFPQGELVNTFLLVVSAIIYFIAPIIVAWKKIPIHVFLKYFVSLDMPITILTVIASAILSGAYAIINKSPFAPISIIHFFLITILTLISSTGIAYFMKQAIGLRREGEEF